MKNRLKKIFGPNFKDSLGEVTFFTFFAFLPVLIAFIFHYATTSNFNSSLSKAIKPSELVTYSISFLVPTMYYILVKNHGKNYSLPYISLISPIVILIYVTNFFFYLANKNGWITLETPTNIFIYIVLGSILISLILRVYSSFHNKNYSSEYFKNREKTQESLNDKFSQKVLNRK